jgi:nitroimidazol reductase NimA-like FMN-containing flavoprotein (pyridoxamine 5'-phosphate oxidase superfamily)
MNTTDSKPLAALGEAESVALLGTQKVGRLVFTRWALPAVTPVNFVLRDGAIWIWTASTSSTWQAVRGAVVAFEVDQLDAGTRTGWSVVVLGVAELVTRPEEIEEARRYGPEPWIPGREEHLIRIPLKLVSGRRIRRGESDEGAFESMSGDSPLAAVSEGR